ncbi:transglutaminase family protein [Aquabacter sp. L1I39]|uniref:transglutaminase family protein n=1 Tax=Aquabacter sp. L1I39 TaxID=2820278 RepID=UPI001ADBE10B|nr:transglutaminase family protein [Aquabacter sp. L1I39]QTL04564.1 transglutaminase family protein [Aquabacter sp. L1I39]
MITLRISHRTTYRYSEPVRLCPHRLMLRPRVGGAVRLIGHQVLTDPYGHLAFGSDVFGNDLVTATFPAPTDRLSIQAVSTVELSDPRPPRASLAPEAATYPLIYPDADWSDLGALTSFHSPDPDGRLMAFAQGFVAGPGTDTLALLADLNAGIARRLRYVIRTFESAQAPLETLDLGFGSCRDYAVLFAEAARRLGFGARLVSGYLFTPNRIPFGPQDQGATHAWAEIFLPGAGWVAFDPTNSTVAGGDLIPVAVARTMDLATPVSGTYLGNNNVFQGMDVEVSVTPAW